jgi:hypothetical protein
MELVTAAAAVGERAEITIRTEPGVACQFSVLSPAVASPESTVVAGSDGLATWARRMESAATYEILVSCGVRSERVNIAVS